VAKKWPGLILDLDRTAVSGESAGGYLALQSGFLFPSADIKVVMGQYCAIYPDIKWRPGPAEGAVEANEFIEAYLAQIKPGDIRLTSPFPERVDLGDAMRQSGRYNEWIGEDERLRLDYCLRTAESIPPIWIMQGTEDSRVSHLPWLETIWN
jgi:acetyl esterase/lipase